MSVSHDERQDRLLWRLNTREGHEYKFWLTRRMLARLLPALNQALLKIHATDPAVVASDTATLQMVRDFKREDMLARADFKTPFVSTGQKHPLVQEALLLTDVRLSMNKPRSLGLLLEQKTGDGTHSCQLSLSIDSVEGLLVLIQKALKNADWALPEIPKAEPDPSAKALAKPSTNPNYRH